MSFDKMCLGRVYPYKQICGGEQRNYFLKGMLLPRARDAPDSTQEATGHVVMFSLKLTPPHPGVVGKQFMKRRMGIIHLELSVWWLRCQKKGI